MTSRATTRPRIGIVRQVMVADLSHYLDLSEDTPASARRMAAQLSGIVRAATAGGPGAAWESAVPCRRRPAHRTCPGRVLVQRPLLGGPIQWQCSRCEDTGTISRWEGSPFDLRRHGLTGVGDLRDVVVSAEVAAALRDLQLLDPDCERLVYRLAAHPDGGAILSASDAELDELVGAVAAEANHEPNRRRQQRLDRAFDALDAATGAGW